MNRITRKQQDHVIILMIAITTMMMVFLTGCSTKTTSKEESEPSRESTVETMTEEAVVEESIEGEAKTEEIIETKEKQEERKQTLDEWVDSLNLSELKYCVWNESKGMGIVLENNQTYELEDGDIILIYKPEGIETMTIPNETSINGVDAHERYNILDLTYYNKETKFQTTIKSKDGQEYKFDFSIVLPSSVEIKSIKALSGDEWEKIISKEKPAFIVWNDKTGEKTMIPDGEEYQLKEGDEIAIYHGINRYLSDIIQPAGCKLDYRTHCTRLVYASSNEPIEFKAQLASFDDANDVVEASFTLLPME